MITPMGRRTTVIGAVLVVGTLVLAACGSGADAADRTTAPSTASAPSPEGAGTGTDTGTATGGCSHSAVEPRTVQYQHVDGVDPDLLSVDVYGPPAGCPPVPVVFWVHGGGWSTGDKANPSTATKAAWAAENGWALVAVNYRLSAPGAGVVWPTHGQDVAAAVGHTLDHAAELGIDPQRVALMGHSAGGHLVSIVSVDPALLAAVGHDRTDVDCLVSLDTEGYDLQERIDTGSDLTDEMLANAFGTDPAALAAASPLQVLEQAGGPVPDAVIVTRGLPRRRAQAEAFADALRGAGAEVTVVQADGYSHADVNARLGAAGETLETPTITSFLHSCLS